MGNRLYRSETDRMISGVSGGLADHFDMDPVIVRILWVVLCVFSGGLIAIVYLAMWVITPEYSTVYGEEEYEDEEPDLEAEAEDGESDTARDGEGSEPTEAGEESARAAPDRARIAQARQRRRRGRRSGRSTARPAAILGVMLIVIGGIALLGSFDVFSFFNPWRLWPIILVAGGLGIILSRRS